MLDQILSRLDLVRRAPHGWMARCPAHHDKTPSLSIRDLDRVVLHCFAGCLEEDCWRALGMERPGQMAPATQFQRALTIAMRQPWYREREQRRAEGTARAIHSQVAELRRDATLLGDCDEAWEFLETAAALERQAWIMAA